MKHLCPCGCGNWILEQERVDKVYFNGVKKMECKKCKTENGYIKQSTNEWICRKCGTKTKLKGVK